MPNSLDLFADALEATSFYLAAKDKTPRAAETLRKMAQSFMEKAELVARRQGEALPSIQAGLAYLKDRCAHNAEMARRSKSNSIPVRYLNTPADVLIGFN